MLRISSVSASETRFFPTEPELGWLVQFWAFCSPTSWIREFVGVGLQGSLVQEGGKDVADKGFGPVKRIVKGAARCTPENSRRVRQIVRREHDINLAMLKANSLRHSLSLFPHSSPDGGWDHQAEETVAYGGQRQIGNV
jgi:hypothetical protein